MEGREGKEENLGCERRKEKEGRKGMKEGGKGKERKGREGKEGKKEGVVKEGRMYALPSFASFMTSFLLSFRH